MLNEVKLFSLKDYDGLSHNVMALDESVDIIKHFSDFSDWEEFKQDFGADRNKVIRYMVLLYDIESPIKKKIPDYVRAKQVCAEIAGFTADEEGRFPENVDVILRCKSEEFNRMLVRYLRYFMSDTYTMITTMREAFYNAQVLIVAADPEKGNKSAIEIEKIRGDIIIKANDLRGTIDKLVREFSRSEHSPYFQKDLFRIIDEDSKRLPITAELQARLP